MEKKKKKKKLKKNLNTVRLSPTGVVIFHIPPLSPEFQTPLLPFSLSLPEEVWRWKEIRDWPKPRDKSCKGSCHSAKRSLCRNTISPRPLPADSRVRVESRKKTATFDHSLLWLRTTFAKIFLIFWKLNTERGAETGAIFTSQPLKFKWFKKLFESHFAKYFRTNLRIPLFLWLSFFLLAWSICACLKIRSLYT